MRAPEITCVIAAFENVELLATCLDSVLAQRGAAIEVIVTDDSRSGAVAELLSTRDQGGANGPVRRLEGPRSGNPIDNWNAGLDAARAPLRMLIHHDEWLIEP